jgi:L-threonylcarbamoyladenylate synthase
MKTRIIPAQDSHAIEDAISVLDGGGILVFPTDTVYGLATRVEDPQVIRQLFEVKGRVKDQAIAVLMGRAEDLDLVADHPSLEAQKLADKFWPGPLTLVVPRHERLPDILSPLPTIGVRIPDHPVALALLRASGPLAVTSANLSGQANTCSVEEVLAQLDGRVELVLDGGLTPGGKPSTVVDTTGEQIKILREGPILKVDLLCALRE